MCELNTGYNIWGLTKQCIGEERQGVQMNIPQAMSSPTTNVIFT